MKLMNNRALIFAGAGASKAVNANKFPTTVEFFERLPSSITENLLFLHIVGFLRRSNAERIIDIEEVLWELSQLQQFAHDANLGEGIIGYSLSGEVILNVLGYSRPQHSFGQFSSAISNLEQQCKSLIEAINEMVYDFYSYEPLDGELEDNWLYLFEKLHNLKIDYDIFTTNYDLAIETAAAIDETQKVDRFRGLSGHVSKKIDLTYWRDQDSQYPLLTKLHGSINWQWGGEEIHVSASLFTGNHDKHAIIYPGFKGRSENTFFGPMHDFFANKIQQANTLIFIGFAFRDEYINQMMAEAVQPDARVVVITMDKSVRIPSSRIRAQYITDGFDSKSIDKALNLGASKRKVA
jgi:SIR2-like domain